MKSFFWYLFCGLISACLWGSCKQTVKKGQAADNTYSVNAADTVTDVKTIIVKVNSLVSTNRMDDAASYVTANLHRFSGTDKALLLNERGGAYFLKDDMDHAIADYLTAMEIDSSNSLYLINVAKTYENMESRSNAIFFAKKIFDLKTATDSDKTLAQDLILRCDRIHSGR